MPIEEQLLPSKKLASFYQKVSWLYVCRTFKKGQPKDIEALRTHDRFGISSWPQMFLFDPRTDRVLGSPPRQLDGFIGVFKQVLAGYESGEVEHLEEGGRIGKKIAEARSLYKKGARDDAVGLLHQLSRGQDEFEGWIEARELLGEWQKLAKGTRKERLADPDPRERAIALEELADGGEKGKTGELRQEVMSLLADSKEDIVVRMRALRYLRKVGGLELGEQAGSLLEVANDPWRYEILAQLKEHPEPGLTPVLVKMFEGAGSRVQSRNPNVLRIRIAQCLEFSGDASAIEALAGPARECALRNGLTRIVFKTLGGIGSRLQGSEKQKVMAILVGSLPPAVAAGEDQSTERRSLYLVGEILASLGRVRGEQGLPPLPAGWTARDRRSLTQQLEKLL